jgi:hypothetical protein
VQGGGTTGGTVGRPRASIAALLFAAAVVLSGSGLGRSGLWDPWESDAADAARTLAAPRTKADPQSDDARVKEASRRPLLRSALVAVSVRLAGHSPWGARLGGVLAGALAVVLLYLALSILVGERGALWSALVMLSLPSHWLHASLLVGDAATILTTTAAYGLLAVAVAAPVGGWVRLAAWIVGFGGAALGVLANGALAGALVPLGAVAVAATLSGGLRFDRAAPERLPLLAVVGGCALFGAVVVVHLVRRDGLEDLAALLETLGARADRPGESLAHVLLAGGVVKSQPLPTFEALLEQVLHGSWPWSIVLPLAVAHVARVPAVAPVSVRFTRVLVVVGLAGAYAAGAFLAGRVGLRGLPGVPLLAVALGLWLADLEKEGRPRRLEAIAIGVVALMLIRDWLLYPAGPLRSLELTDLVFPESLRAGRLYAPAAALFGALAYFVVAQGASAPPAVVRPWLERVMQAVRTRLAVRILWFVFCVAWAYLAISAIVILTKVSLIPWSLMTRLARRVHLVVLPLPLGVVGAWLAYQLGWEGVRRLSSRRVPLLVGVAVLSAALGVQGLLPSLGKELSSREVFETLEKLRRSGEPLAEFRTKGRAASAAGLGEVEELGTAGAVATYLDTPGRRWVVFPAAELAAVHSAVRVRRANRTATRADLALRVLDDESTRLFLASNEVRRGERDQNPLSRAVLSSPPRPPQHPLSASFEGKVDYLGYDLPGGPELGAGEELTITYHFRCNTRPPAYKMFVHIDGQGARLNGDHDPVDGRYPLRYWAPDDYILDRQTLRVPAHFRPGDYTIFLGFFEGERRMRVTNGPADDVNRVEGGILRVR